jgi:hypothetical protein
MVYRTCVREHEPDMWAVRADGKWYCTDCHNENERRRREVEAQHPDAVVSLLMVAGEHKGFSMIEERIEAVAMMDKMGHFTLAQMAERTGCTPRTVSRYLTWIRKVAK